AGDDVGMAGVVEYAEVLVALGSHRIDDLHDLRWFVEQEAGLELPADVHAVVGGNLAALVPDGDQTVHGDLGVDVFTGGLEEVRGLDGIDADGLDAEVGAERGEAEEGGDVGDGVLVENRRPRFL